jgi:uncharacterized protein (TIGR02597 family)
MTRIWVTYRLLVPPNPFKKLFRHPSCNLTGVLSAVVFSLTTAAFVSAQSAATDPVGFLSDTVPAQSDAAVTAPLTRPPAFQGVIASISGTTITVNGSPNWQTSPKQFVRVAGSQPDTFYAQIGNGTKAGLYAAITDNGTNSLVVQLNAGDDLTGIATEASAGTGNGAKIVIFPFWTPDTLFPTNWPAGTEVLLYDTSSAGVNSAPTQVLNFNGTLWRDEADFSDASNLLIHPADSFVIRNNSASSIGRVVMGNVPMIHHRSVISTLAANTPQDNRIAYSCPTSQVIGTVGLGFTTGDELLVFDNAAPGTNKSASQVLRYTGSGWRDEATFADVTNTFSLQPGKGYVYRKVATASAQDFVWQAAQPYNP